MKQEIADREWEMLLRRIRLGKCTPFLGAGACYGVLPLGADLAAEWAERVRYPLDDRHDLARVAQYLAIRYDGVYPKDLIIDRFRDAGLPDFMEPDEPHAVLADLPLKVYLTTNYDDFMTRALRRVGKEPKREYYRWNAYVRKKTSIFDTKDGFQPTPESPLVFHLHGHNEDEQSIVLTEEDYLDYLVNLSRENYELPKPVQLAISGSSLLFVGYSLTDWSFRVLFRGLVTANEGSQRHVSITVQLPPPSPDVGAEEQRRIQQYLSDYFKRSDMTVYWGTARQFMAELRKRWNEFQNGS